MMLCVVCREFLVGESPTVLELLVVLVFIRFSPSTDSVVFFFSEVNNLSIWPRLRGRVGYQPRRT